MRSASALRWAGFALALVVSSSSVFAQPNKAAPARAKRSVAECATFDQADKGDDGVALTVRNSCSMPVACSMSWTLVCAPESKKRKALHKEAANFTLPDGGSESRDASPATCGADGWSIENIQWSCAPVRD
jgi:hypothetical protein